MASLKIKKGDTVKVIAGKDKDKVHRRRANAVPEVPAYTATKIN